MSSSDSTFLVAESRDGKPALGGKRRLVDGVEDALGAADAIGGSAYALERVEENAYPPRPAVSHVATVLEVNSATSAFYAAVPDPHTCRPDAMPEDAA